MLNDSTLSERHSPEGLGGWLILLLLEIWVNAAARLAAGISSLAVIFHVAVPSAFAAALTPFSSAVAVVAGLFGAVTGFFLARKSTRGPALAKALLSLDAGYYLLYLLVIAFRIGPVAAESLPLWLKPAALCLVSIVSLGYLLRSRRVANTYSPRLLGPNPSEVFENDENSDVLRNRIFPWEEVRASQQPDPAALESGPPALAAENPALESTESEESAAHHSRLFRDETGQLVPAEQAENGHMPSIPRSEPVRIERRKEREVWPTHRFTPEGLDPETSNARLFHDDIPAPAQSVPPLHEQNGHLPVARKLASRNATPLLNEESWPPPEFDPAPSEPPHHQSRIFSRESMLGATQPVPASEQEQHTPFGRTEPGSARSPRAGSVAGGAFVAETTAPVSQNGNLHPVNSLEPEPEEAHPRVSTFRRRISRRKQFLPRPSAAETLANPGT